MRRSEVIFLAGLFALVGVLLPSCYYDQENKLYPNGCNTTNVSYSKNILPLLDRYACSSCHDSQSQQGGVNLEGYDNMIFYVENGRLMGSIRHDPGYEPMPLGTARMNTCDISKFQAWVDSGAPNN